MARTTATTRGPRAIEPIVPRTCMSHLSHTAQENPNQADHRSSGLEPMNNEVIASWNTCGLGDKPVAPGARTSQGRGIRPEQPDARSEFSEEAPAPGSIVQPSLPAVLQAAVAAQSDLAATAGAHGVDGAFHGLAQSAAQGHATVGGIQSHVGDTGVVEPQVALGQIVAPQQWAVSRDLDVVQEAFASVFVRVGAAGAARKAIQGVLLQGSAASETSGRLHTIRGRDAQDGSRRVGRPVGAILMACSLPRAMLPQGRAYSPSSGDNVDAALASGV